MLNSNWISESQTNDCLGGSSDTTDPWEDLKACESRVQKVERACWSGWKVIGVSEERLEDDGVTRVLFLLFELHTPTLRARGEMVVVKWTA